MADFTANRVGQINQAGDDKAIFLRKWSGEVLMQFQILNVMMNRTFVKDSVDGKSVQWPRMGRATAAYHPAGVELTGANGVHSEINALIDNLLTADTFLDKLDNAMNHWDARSRHTEELARVLANKMDEHIIIEGLKGARLTAVGSELPTGTPVNGTHTGDLAFATNDKFGLTGEVTGGVPAANVEEQVANILAALDSAAGAFDERHIPGQNQVGVRYAAFRPKIYRRLAQTLQSSGFSGVHRDLGGVGSIATGQIPMYAGFDIIPTTQLPKSNLGTSGTYTYHGGDYTKTIALLGFNDAIGVGKALDLNVEEEYTVRHQGTLYVASYAVTEKYLRPEGLLELVMGTSVHA